MKMFLLGMMVLYLVFVIGFAIAESFGKEDEFLRVILFPVIVFLMAVEFVWVKVFHYGMEQVYSEEKGWHWRKKKRGNR